MKSLAMKLDELSQVGTFRQYTFEERMSVYATYPDSEREYCINEAREYHAKGFTCNEFTLNDGRVDSVIQWQKPSTFVKNCYAWFIKN
jgi:hypothetical protein